STQTTSLPRSAKTAPVTSPTYPIPTTQIFTASHHSRRPLRGRPVSASGALRDGRARVRRVLLQLVLQRAKADSELTGRFGAAAADLVERIEDVPPLDLGEGQPWLEGQRPSSARRARRDVVRKQLELRQYVSLGQHDALLEKIFQLANVARPRH